jgi:ATP-binding cassette subfamily F protein uup
MVAQRGYGVIAPELEKAAKPDRPTAPTPPPASKAKLSFKQKHALETLPKEIVRQTTEISRLNTLLADPALYSRDPKGFADASAKLAAAEAAKAKAEDEWLELEVLRESLES